MKRAVFIKYIAAVGGVIGAALLAGCISATPATIATYNIHIGIGLDKKYDLDRTAEAIRQIGAETVVLNEVDVGTRRSRMVDQAAFLAEKLGMDYVFGAACQLRPGVYGNAVLSIYKVEKLDLIDLPGNGRESRSALVVKIHAPQPYFVIATHWAFEQNPEIEAVRIKCIEMLADHVKARGYSPVLLCGDLNALPNSKVIQKLQACGFKVVNDLSGKMRSYPSRDPRRLLDYLAIYPADSADAVNCRVIDTQASDHCPVAAEFIFF